MKRLRAPSSQAVTLLAALAERPDDWQHGYDLGNSLDIKSGTLYPLLMRLAAQGYLEAKWVESSQPGRPPRHAYRLTLSGLHLAQAQAAPLPASHKPSPA